MDHFPGGSKTRINLAGDHIRHREATLEDIEAVEEWRAAHREVLNTFQASLRTKAKGRNIVVAQRHKRRNTIFDKLDRLPKMELARMDDVAGCRLIFESIEELSYFRCEFHKSNFRHKIKNSLDKYDYIKKPKDTGYRGVHDVYSYDVKSKKGAHLKGLLVEVQYRTLIQHAWATAVEVVGFITESQPKFKKGDNRYEICMALASEILARAHEGLYGPYPSLSNEELLARFYALDGELHLVRTLTGLSISDAGSSDNKNSILIFRPDGGLDIKTYPDATVALKELFRLERESPALDVVLVRADTTEDIRIAFRNYFSDAKDFVRLLTEAQKLLSDES